MSHLPVVQRMPDRDGAESDLALFRRMVESVGVKRFAAELGVSTRQINRILAGVQPNPVHRLLMSLQACTPDVGDAVLDHICQEMGGYFVREEGSLDSASVNAVRECAEAIAAISDGQISRVDQIEIREAIAALIALSRSARGETHDASDAEPTVRGIAVGRSTHAPAVNADGLAPAARGGAGAFDGSAGAQAIRTP